MEDKKCISYIDIKNSDGKMYTFSISKGKDLGKYEIIIINQEKKTQENFKKIKKTLKYLNKKKFSPEEIKRVLDLNDSRMRLRSQESLVIKSPVFSYGKSKM